MDLKNYFKKRKLAGDQTVIKELWREIFIEKQYEFSSLSESPFILDIGANIGIATLYFKRICPEAKIKAFEPVPASFSDLEKNTKNLENIQIFNVGISDKDENGIIYGESDTSVESTAKKLVGKFSEEQLKPIPVVFKKLSPFITEPVDFLKIDIEGYEGKVFKELEESGKLKMVKEIVMEYHYNVENKENELGEMISRFHRNGFELQISTGDKKTMYPFIIRAKKIN